MAIYSSYFSKNAGLVKYYIPQSASYIYPVTETGSDVYQLPNITKLYTSVPYYIDHALVVLWDFPM